MPANRCRNPICEYFNKTLPDNAKVCPWCSTPLGNVIGSTPPQPAPPQPIPPQPIPPQPIPQQPIPQQPIPQQPIPQQPIPQQQIPPQPTPQPSYPPIVDERTNYQQRASIPPTPPPYTPPTPRLPLLKLIHSSGREFQWSGEAGIIGRRSQNKPIPPEIDLTGIPNEGIVSRSHARVSWDWAQNSYMIVDMSTNGIYLNGNILSPGVPYRIMNGDVLQFGQDNLVMFTVYVM